MDNRTEAAQKGTEQSESQVDWQTQVYRNAEKSRRDDRSDSSYKPTPTPALLALETAGSLPVFRTSC